MTITFTVPGDPVAWARSRHRGAHHYTAPKQKAHLNTVATYALAARPRGFTLLGGPLRLDVVAIFKRTRTCRNKYDPHEVACPLGDGKVFWHPTNMRLDWDNIGKQISDAIRGVLILEDGMIVDGRVWKVCADQEPSTGITVRSLG